MEAAPETTPLWPDTPEAFCAALKAARVRRGLSLADISRQTKITESHFVALERADLRHWPKGIFRRAFFSEYVRAIGLPIEPAVAAFSRLFPEAASAPEEPAVDRAERFPRGQDRKSGDAMRLALARGPLIPPGAASRARLAALDAALVIAAAAACARMAGSDLAAAIAIVALVYYSLAVVIGRPHPGPTLVLRTLRFLPKRRPIGPAANAVLQETCGNVLRGVWSRIRGVRWPALDVQRLKVMDLRRLKDATPRVLERLQRRDTGRDRAERQMARPRPDSPRHLRRHQDQSGDSGVRVRIRLTRRE